MIARDLRCQVPGCGAMLDIFVEHGRMVEQCPSCRRRLQLYNPAKLREPRCVTCRALVPRNPKGGKDPSYCRPCRKARHAAQERESKARRIARRATAQDSP